MGKLRKPGALACLAVVMAAVGAGCGGGGDDGGGAVAAPPGERADERREAYIDAFLSSGDSGEEVDLSEGRCVNGALVDAFGVERLEEEVGTPDEIRADPGLLEDAMAAMAGDVVDRNLVRAMYACPGMREMTVAEFAGDDATRDQVTCVDEALTDDFLVWLWSWSLRGPGSGGPPPPEAEDRFREQFGACGVVD